MTRVHAAAALCAAALAVAGLVAPAASAVPAPTTASHAGSRAATGYRLNPPHNITPPRSVYRQACQRRPTGAKCTSIMLAALNHARGVMKQPKYHVPARFASLQPQEQLLVLANLDRELYGRTHLTGLNARLDRSATTGARQRRDPSFVMRVNGARLEAGASNWAGGTAPMGTPLFAYYEWMYDDGPGSGNLDCHHKGDPGCWGHRDGTLLAVPKSIQMELGVGRAKPSGEFSWTELFEGFSAQATIPCVPTVTGLSQYRSAAGHRTRFTVRGFGFVHVRTVTVLGSAARIVKHSPYALTVVAPRHRAGSGFVVVTTSGGTSNQTRAAAYRYAA